VRQMIGPNVFRFDLESKDHGVGRYCIGEDRWVEVLMYDGSPVAAVWNGSHQTVKRFEGLPARLIAIKMLEIGIPVEELPEWCIPLMMRSSSPPIGKRESKHEFYHL